MKKQQIAVAIQGVSSIPSAFEKQILLNTICEQLGHSSIRACRDKLNETNMEQRIAGNIEMVGGIDAYNELKNDEAEAEFNLQGTDELGFSAVPAVPMMIMGAYKRFWLDLSRTQGFAQRPPQSLAQLINSQENIEPETSAVELAKTTDEFLTSIEDGLDTDLIKRGVESRRASRQRTQTERSSRLLEFATTEFQSANIENLGNVWEELPAYIRWKMLIAVYRQLNRRIGANKEDAVENAKSRRQFAVDPAATHEAMVNAAKSIKEQLEQMLIDDKQELAVAFEAGRLSENHMLN